MIRLKTVGTEWKVVEALSNLKSTESNEDWEISFVTPVYGGWDIVVECTFTKLKELDKIISFLNLDEQISQWIEETTSLVSSKPDYSNS